MSQERRCGSCGALVSTEAEWCGQCFAPLQPVDAADVGATAVGSSSSVRAATEIGLEIQDGHTTWACPVCETRNAIQESYCTTCGTPFGRLFEAPAEVPEVDPQTAAVWSMVFPGLGHWKLGRKGDAVARFTMFGWSFGALLILLASRFGKGGLGSAAPLFLLFLLGSISIYVTSAVDAYRLASGDQALVSSLALLWGSVGLIVLSILIATLVTLPAARR